MSAIETNKESARRFYDELMNQGRIEVVEELVADHYIEHEVIPGISPDKDGLKEWVRMFRNAFPDLKANVEDIIAEGDKIVAHGRMTGTHTGDLFGNPGTGRKLDLPFADIARFQNGKCVEHWGYSDTLKMVEQLQLDLSAVQ